jgi:hypothetical protein
MELAYTNYTNVDAGVAATGRHPARWFDPPGRPTLANRST